MKDKNERTNWPVTILLIAGCITVFFPLYMAIMIAFKKPSEMTNDIAGALSLPSSWSFENFAEAMRVTDFWHSLGNSLLITIITVVLAILLHSVLAYAIGRSMTGSKGYRFIYYYIVSGMFVPFAILMMPLVKQTAQMGLDNRAGVIILYLVFYMPINLLLYTGYLKNIPMALEEAAYVDGATTWYMFWHIIFPMMKPMHATVAVLTALAAFGNGAAKHHKKIRDIFFKQDTQFPAYNLITLIFIAAGIEHVAGLGTAIDEFARAAETDDACLVSTAGGRTAGDMHLRQCIAWDICLPGSLDT